MNLKWKDFSESVYVEAEKNRAKLDEAYEMQLAIKRLKEESHADLDAFNTTHESEIQEIATMIEKLGENDDEELRKKIIDKAVEYGANATSYKSTADSLELYEKVAKILYELDFERATVAEKALEASEKFEAYLRENGEWLEYEESATGFLESLGVFETGSPEWLESRQSGIGGSDFYTIAHESDLTDFLESKFKKITEEDSQVEQDYATAIGRGNAFEEFIRHEFASRHPELNVAHCKTSWQSTLNPVMRCNFDGVILDDSGKPEAIVEIKTGRRSRWNKEAFKKGAFSKGVSTPDAIVCTSSEELIPEVEEFGKRKPVRGFVYDLPAEYVYQVMWYAMQAGVSTAYIVAILDDLHYREFVIDVAMLSKEMNFTGLAEKVLETWDEIQNSERDENGIPVIAKKIKRKLKVDNPSGMTLTTALAETVKAYNYAEYTQSELKNLLADSDFAETLFPSTIETGFMGIDIETSSFSPETGRILQLAMVEYDSVSGAVTEKADFYYDIPEEAKQVYGRGYGAVEVHGIDETVVSGKQSFDKSSGDYSEILGLMLGKTLVAHNFGFEERFLSRVLPGYLHLKYAGGFKKLDTRNLCRFLYPSHKTTLQAFVEQSGGEYLDAHNALKDTAMMMEALKRTVVGEKSFYN